MSANVLKRAERAVVAANDEYGVGAAAVFEVVAGFGDMVDRAGDLPHLGPHPLRFELCKRGGVVALCRYQRGALRRRADRILLAEVRWVADCEAGLRCVRHGSPSQVGAVVL